MPHYRPPARSQRDGSISLICTFALRWQLIENLLTLVICWEQHNIFFMTICVVQIFSCYWKRTIQTHSHFHLDLGWFMLLSSQSQVKYYTGACQQCNTWLSDCQHFHHKFLFSEAYDFVVKCRLWEESCKVVLSYKTANKIKKLVASNSFFALYHLKGPIKCLFCCSAECDKPVYGIINNTISLGKILK